MAYRISALALLLVIMSIVNGCAYHHFQRQYRISGISEQLDDTKVGTVLSEFFSSRGLALKRQFTQTYPARSINLVFTPPVTRDVDRKDADLIVTISPGNVVTIQHSEWFLHPGVIPQDYVESIASDLGAVLNRQFSGSVVVSFESKSYF